MKIFLNTLEDMEQRLLETPVCMMTGAEFIELQRMALKEQERIVEQQAIPTTEKRYVYGLRGIRELFNVSHATAQKLKDGILAPAVKQYGRKIVVDEELALQLFNSERRV